MYQLSGTRSIMHTLGCARSGVLQSPINEYHVADCSGTSVGRLLKAQKQHHFNSAAVTSDEKMPSVLARIGGKFSLLMQVMMWVSTGT